MLLWVVEANLVRNPRDVEEQGLDGGPVKRNTREGEMEAGEKKERRMARAWVLDYHGGEDSSLRDGWMDAENNPTKGMGRHP